MEFSAHLYRRTKEDTGEQFFCVYRLGREVSRVSQERKE